MVVRLVLLAFLPGLVLACGFQGGVGPGFQCGEGDWCPAGQVCQAGVCVLEPGEPDARGSDDDADVDAASPDAAPPAARCGTLSLLRDDFADGVIGNQWDAWTDGGVTVQETGGAIVVELAQGTLDRWAGAISNAHYDFVGGALSVEVVEIGGEFTMIEVLGHTGVAAQLYVRAGLITAKIYQGPLDGVRAEAAYQLETHRYWRLREDGGRIYWETSPDRITWNVLHDEASPFPLAHVRGGVAAGVQQAGGITRARFADVNLDAPVALVFCPGTDLADDFEDGVIDPGLRVIDETGCTVTETGGVLRFAFDSSGNDRCQVKSRHLFDLRDSEVRIDVGGAFSGPNAPSWFQLEDRADTSSRLEIQLDDGALELGQRLLGVGVDFASIPYDPVAHRWWRMRGAAGRIYLETSPDAATWTARLDRPAVLDLSQVRLELGAETLTTTTPMTFPVAAMNTPN